MTKVLIGTLVLFVSASAIARPSKAKTAKRETPAPCVCGGTLDPRCPDRLRVPATPVYSGIVVNPCGGGLY